MNGTSIEARAEAAFSEDEWRLRVDLAACYRLAWLFGWDDLLATHISARVGDEGHFLINPLGLAFDEITASSLLRVSCEGVIQHPTPYRMNSAGFAIHSAVYQSRPDAGCVIHLHTVDGIAVSSLAEGLLPLNQTALLVYGDLAYHAFEGVAGDLDERERIQRDLGDHNHLILRNHGTLTVGKAISDAFVRIYGLERACAIQVRTLSMQRPLAEIMPEAISRTRAIALQIDKYGDLAWPAMRRRVDRDCPGYDD
jgi:ribulose-5-phosphate 4-epimerase/fuculose-1-phosphate aldolase